MGERDAFGREKGENTLADMGWSTTGPAAWESAPVTKGDPQAAPSPFDAGEAEAPFRPKPKPEPAPAPAPEPEAVFSAGEAAAPLKPKPAPRPSFQRPPRRRSGF